MHSKWFSSCLCLRYECANPISQLAWDEGLRKLHHRPISENQRQSCGFSSPFGYLAPNAISHEMQGYLFLSLTYEKKTVPRNKLNRLFMQRLEELAKREGGSITDIKGAQRKEIKERTEEELLKKTLPDETYINIIIDTKRQQLYVDTSSKAQLDLIESKIQQIDESYTHRPYFDASVEVYLTRWIYDPAQNLPRQVALDNEATLLNDEKAKAAFTNQDLESDELINLIRHDKRVTELGLVYDGRMKFKLNANGQLKKLKPSDVLLSDIQKEHDPQGVIEDLEAYWMVLAGSLAELYEWLGGLFAVNNDSASSASENQEAEGESAAPTEAAAEEEPDSSFSELAQAMGGS